MFHRRLVGAEFQHHPLDLRVQPRQPQRQLAAFRGADTVGDMGEPASRHIHDAPSGAPEPRIEADHPHYAYPRSTGLFHD